MRPVMNLDKSQMTGGASVLLSLVLAAFLFNQFANKPAKTHTPLKPVPQQVEKPPKPADPKPTQRSTQASEATFQAVSLPPPPAPAPSKTVEASVKEPEPAKPTPAPKPVAKPKPPKKPEAKVEPKPQPKATVKKVEAQPAPKPVAQPRVIKALKPTVKEAPLTVAEAKPVPAQPKIQKTEAKIIKPIQTQVLKTEAPHEAKPEPEPHKEVRLSQHTIRTSESKGRVLLRQLEKGAGPAIAIEWPGDPSRADALYRTLRSCYGMRTALLVEGEGSLYVADGVSGRPWRPHRGSISGFVRQPDGQIPTPEQRTIRSIESLHGLHSATPVRIFPRREDSVLLGGLLQLVGAGYKNAKEIHARYQLQGRAVAVTDVTVDGQALSGRVVMDWGCGS